MDQVRAILEGIWTLLLGSFCRSDAILQHRCNYGLFDIGDDVVGGNKTPCWEDVESVAVGYEESENGQVLDAEYQAAARLVRLMHWFIEKAAESGDAVAEAKQRTKLWAARVASESVLASLWPNGLLFRLKRGVTPEGRAYFWKWMGVWPPNRLVEEMDELTDGDWLLRLVVGGATSVRSLSEAYRPLLKKLAVVAVAADDVYGDEKTWVTNVYSLPDNVARFWERAASSAPDAALRWAAHDVIKQHIIKRRHRRSPHLRER